MNRSVLMLLCCAIFCSGCKKTSTINGYVAADTILISAPFGGELKHLWVQEGQQLKPNTPIADVDTTLLKYQLAQATATLKAEQQKLANLEHGRRPAYLKLLAAQQNQAKSQFSYAKKTYDRAKKLHTRASISDAAFDRALSQYQQSQYALQAAQQQLAYAKLPARQAEIAAQHHQSNKAKDLRQQYIWQIQQQHLTSHTAATVLQTFYRPHEYVAANSPIVELMPKNARYVVFYLTPAQHQQLIQQQATLKLRCANCEHWETTTLRAIEPRSDFMPQALFSGQPPGQTTLQARANLPQKSEYQWHPGQPVEVKIDG